MAAARHEIYHSLASALKSGLPVLRALELTSRTARGAFRRALLDVRDAAAAGEMIGAAMGRHPEVFSALEVFAVEAAETSGHLPEAMERLSQYYAYRDKLRRTALSGLALPVIILHLAAFVGPFPELILGTMSTTGYLLRVLVPLLFLYVPFAAIFAIVRFTPETGPLRSLVDGVTLMIPVLGRGVRQLSLSRFARTFQMLYSTGSVPIADCVSKAADAAGNTVVRRWVIGGAARAAEGRPVSEGFSAGLPEGFVAAWQVGEESGKLDEATSRLADQAAEDAERLFARLAVWLPRIVYALVCVYLVYSILGRFLSIYGPGGMYDSVLKEL